MKEGGIELGHEAKTSSSSSKLRLVGGVNKGLSIMDFVLRLTAIVGTLAGTAAMGTTGETLPFSTQFVRFRAEYDDFPAFTVFVVANAVACGYLVLSLGFSIFHIVRSNAQKTRILLIICDVIILSFLTAAASASTGIVYLAHNGNSSTNWLAICRQYNAFCERISGALVASFVGVAMIMLLILLSAIAMARR